MLGTVPDVSTYWWQALLKPLIVDCRWLLMQSSHSGASATAFGAQGHQTRSGQGECTRACQRDVGGWELTSRSPQTCRLTWTWLTGGESMHPVMLLVYPATIISTIYFLYVDMFQICWNETSRHWLGRKYLPVWKSTSCWAPQQNSYSNKQTSLLFSL